MRDGSPRGGRGPLYREDGAGARHYHFIDPRQLPRSPLDEPTYNRLKISDVDLGNTYEIVEGERALEQAERPP